MADVKPNNPDYDAFIDIIRKRRSVRRFEKGRSISREVLEHIAEAGRWAPSGANVQPWDFIVVEDPDMRDRVVEVFLRQADRLKKYANGPVSGIKCSEPGSISLMESPPLSAISRPVRHE